MKNYLRGFITIGLFLLSAQAWAEDTYTLGACYQAALQRSESLADQKELLVQAEEHYQQALGGVLPEVSASAAYGREGTGNYSGFAPGPTDVSDQHFIRLTASQPLFRGFREFAALRSAGDSIHAQTLAKRWAGMQLYSDVVQSFYLVASLEKDLEHITAELDLYRQRIGDLERRVSIGRSRPTEILTVQTSQALLQALQEQVRGQLLVAREVLAFLTGLPSESKLADAEPLPVVKDSLESYLAKLSQRPDVQAAEDREKAARENVTLAANAHYPSLDVSGDYYADHSGPPPTVVWDAQIALTLPIFTGFTLTSKTHEAESLLRQAENDLSQLRRLDAQEIRSDFYNLQSDLTQVAALKNAADLGEKNYRAVLRDYNLGLVTNLDVLTALQSFQDSLRALDRTQYAAKADFERLEAAATQRLALVPEDAR